MTGTSTKGAIMPKMAMATSMANSKLLLAAVKDKRYNKFIHKLFCTIH